MLRSLLHVLLFLAGLLGTAATVLHCDALPFWSWARQKLGYAQQTLDQWDTLFVGSSRVHRGIDPAEFDRRAAELGVATSSYNLGLAGVRPIDFVQVIAWLCQQPKLRAKRCIIEIHGHDQVRAQANRMSDTIIEVHPPSLLPLRVEAAFCYPYTNRKRLELLGNIGAHTLVNGLRVGQGTRLLDDLLRTDPFGPPSPGYQGFDDVKSELQQPERRRNNEEWLGNPAKAQGYLDWKVKVPLPPPLVGGLSTAVIREQARLLREVGIRPIFVVMPVWSQSLQGRDALPELAKELDIVVLDRPDEFPDLFRHEDYFDSDHLTAAGAQRFSKFFAETLIERKLLTADSR
ncbi:MAG: hypothetical protein MUC36_01140 [Planctomycetes bacterium]|jgi:hypothetical protein|nr:hypothetical protein [Planctomycetota bacterium]